MKTRRRPPTERRVKAVDAVGVPERSVEDPFSIDELVTPEKIERIEDQIDRAIRAHERFGLGINGESLELDALLNHQVLTSLRKEHQPDQPTQQTLEHYSEIAGQDLRAELEEYQDDPESDASFSLLQDLGALARLMPEQRDALPAFPAVLHERYDQLRSYHDQMEVDDADAAISMMYNLYSIDLERFRKIGIPKQAIEMIMRRPEEVADEYGSDVVFELAMKLRLMEPERRIMSDELRALFESDMRPERINEVVAYCIVSADRVEIDEHGVPLLTFKTDDLKEAQPLPERSAL